MTVIGTNMTLLINSMTSSDFRDTDVEAAQQTAYLYCSSIFGSTIPFTGDIDNNPAAFEVTDGQQAMAIAMLGAAILLEGRRTIRSRDEDIEVRTIEVLFTKEMRDMLMIADVNDITDADMVAKGNMWDNTNPTGNWEV